MTGFIAILAIAGMVALLAAFWRLEHARPGAAWPPAAGGGGSKADAVFRVAETAAGRIDLGAAEAPDFASEVASRSRRCVGAEKRALDITLALLLIIALAPLYLLIAVLIKIDSPGPVLYRQRRVGFNGVPFEIYKFRSMVDNAEKNGPRWAQHNDLRVTRVGRVIRKLRIDELPQAFNVLRGEMSIVGPRPERPEFVGLLESEIPNYQLRHSVRPGITGWAQVRHEYGASVEDARIKLQYDLFYIRHFNLARDLLILAMTVKVALLGLGSR